MVMRRFLPTQHDKVEPVFAKNSIHENSAIGEPFFRCTLSWVAERKVFFAHRDRLTLYLRNPVGISTPPFYSPFHTHLLFKENSTSCKHMIDRKVWLANEVFSRV